MLGAGDRMRRDEVDALRQMRLHLRRPPAPLTEPTSETIAPGFSARRDLGRDRAAGADRHAEDDEIGAAAASAASSVTLVGEAELAHALAHRRASRSIATIVAAPALQAPAPRAIDEPIRPMPMRARRSNSGSPAAVRGGQARACPAEEVARAPRRRGRLASSLPTVRRSAFGQAVGADRAAATSPRAVRKASAASAVCAGLVGKWMSRKLPTLGVTRRARAPRSRASARRSHFVVVGDGARPTMRRRRRAPRRPAAMRRRR